MKREMLDADNAVTLAREEEKPLGHSRGRELRLMWSDGDKEEGCLNGWMAVLLHRVCRRRLRSD